MSETRHTEGPWEFIDATKSARHRFSPTCIIMSGQKQIASFSWNDTSPYFPTKEQSHANARLIAAAPDMLAALKHVLESNDAKLSHEMAVNAIAKAEGRS